MSKSQFRRKQPESQALEFLRSTIETGMLGTVVAIDPVSHVCIGCAYTHEDMAGVERFIQGHAKAQRNLYWSPNPTRAPLHKKPRKADISMMRWVHVDIDDPSPAALERVRGYKLAPSIIVASGGGYNVYWALTEPIHANGNIAELEDANRRVILDLGGDKGTQDLDRILRLPGTTNYPSKTKIGRGRFPVPAMLVEMHLERTYTLDDFPPLTAQEQADWKTSKKKKEQSAPASANDRSRDLMAKVSKAVRDGLSDAEIHAAFGSHPHVVDQSDAIRTVGRCIEKCRSETSSVIEQINGENALVWINGKLLVMWHRMFERGLPRLSHIADAKNYWKIAQRGKSNPVDVWLGSSQRKQYQGFTFQPGATDTGDLFNLFQGWGVAPDPDGDCSLFLAHLREVICNGDPDLFAYLIQWLANAVQKPMEKPGTAIATRGGQGSGKGAVVRYIGPIFGAHLARVGSSEQLLGKFNAWLAGKILVFGDESCWPGDRRGLEKLKGHITEERIMVEEKNLPIFEIDNYARYFFATNSKHSAHAELDDRRYVALDVSNAHVGDQAYWDALEAERQGTGPAAFLHFLLTVKLTRDLRATPKTAALAEQKLLSLDDVGAFARHLLMKEKHQLDTGFNADSAGTRTLTLEFGEIVGTETLHSFYLDYARRTSVKFPKSLDALGVNLRRYFTMIKREPRKDERERLKLGKGRGVQVYALPILTEARAGFESALGQKVTWPTWKEAK